MKLLLAIFCFVFTPDSYSKDTKEWFCSKNGRQSLDSIRCSKKAIGKKGVSAFCRENSQAKIKNCGAYTIRNNKIVITDSSSGAAKTFTYGPQKTQPVIEQRETSSGDRNWSSGRSAEETSGSGGKFIPGLFGGGKKSRGGGGPLSNDYPPRTPQFSKSQAQAHANTNLEWINTPIVEQAKYLYSKYNTIVTQRGYIFSAAILLCKTRRESMTTVAGKTYFRPQKISGGSTAAGIPQITMTATRDYLRVAKTIGYRSNIPGMESIATAEDLRAQMAGNMILQMEFGAFVLDQKRVEVGCSTVKCALKWYYGNSDRCNRDYANRISECADCIDANGISLGCLEKARSKNGC